MQGVQLGLKAGLLCRSQCAFGRFCDRPTQPKFSLAFPSALEQQLCLYTNLTLVLHASSSLAFFSNLQTRADEPVALVSDMAPGKYSLVRGIHRCPKFFISCCFLRRTPLGLSNPPRQPFLKDPQSRLPGMSDTQLDSHRNIRRYNCTLICFSVDVFKYVDR